MSNTQDNDSDRKPPLPTPVGEDGILHPDDRGGTKDEVEDAGLAETGGGKPDERKIV